MKCKVHNKTAEYHNENVKYTQVGLVFFLGFTFLSVGLVGGWGWVEN
jgi:nitrate reductase NapE component